MRDYLEAAFCTTVAAAEAASPATLAAEAALAAVAEAAPATAEAAPTAAEAAFWVVAAAALAAAEAAEAAAAGLVSLPQAVREAAAAITATRAMTFFIVDPSTENDVIQKQFPEIAFCLRVTVFRKTYSIYNRLRLRREKQFLPLPTTVTADKTKRKAVLFPLAANYRGKHQITDRN